MKCNGKIKIPKYLNVKGLKDDCHNVAKNQCQKCGQYFCSKHITRHECVISGDVE